MKVDVERIEQDRAEHRFRQARREARRERFLAWLKGRDASLLPFQEVRAELRATDPRYRGLQEIALDKIVGSVGRYGDFTRHFMPLSDSLRPRWVGLDILAQTQPWPPIEVYQVGDSYFVIDGNHRVAIARQRGWDVISAHVWLVADDVTVESDEPVDALLIRLGAKNFMAKTGLDSRFPDNTLVVTNPGSYKELLAQIYDLRRLLAYIDGEEMAIPEAAAAWYEMVYLPAALIVEESGIMENFPGRTTCDLVVWLSRNRDALEAQYGEYDHLSELLESVAEDHPLPAMDRVVRQVLRLFGRDLRSRMPDLA
jgi:hypothetical protein